MDEFSEDREWVDIGGFTGRLRTAWKIVPDLPFGEMLGLVFNGYDLRELTHHEMEEMMDEFIMQNQ